MTTYIRCYAKDCGTFFPKKLGECPECLTPIRSTRAGLGKGIRTEKLNAALANQIQHAND